MNNIIAFSLPSSLDGIKKRAKKLKRELGITNTDALERVSRDCGYQNYTHANRVLSASPTRESPVAAAHPRVAEHRSGVTIYISGYFRAEDGSSGRETLAVQAKHAYPSILKASEIRGVGRGLEYFRADAGDHFESRSDFGTQEEARKRVTALANAIAFMDATGLRPATSWAAEERAYGSLYGLPGCDHPSLWVHPATGAIIRVDEPYQGYIGRERDVWGSARGLATATTSWAGIYAPGMTRMYFVAAGAHGETLKAMVSALDALQQAIRGTSWTGESSSYAPTFVSPARASSGKRKTARPSPVKAGEIRNGAVAFGAVGGSTAQWRPNSRMPIAEHMRIGATIKGMLRFGHLPASVRKWLGEVRCRLDDWVQREYSRDELTHDVFIDLYYGKDPEQWSGDPKASITDLLATLWSAYNDSPPLQDVRRTLRKCEAALTRPGAV